MRDLALLAIIVWCCVQALRRPWIGVLCWTWISLMNPHQLTYRLSALPVAAAVGAATLIGLFVTRDRRDFELRREGVMLLVFMTWMCITLPSSFAFDEAFELWKRVMKIDMMIIVAIVLLHTRRHIEALVWVLVISIGFFGVKGGLFTAATGGNYRVWGPDYSYIQGNNEVALAIVMTIPLMRYLQLQMKHALSRHVMTFCMLCMAAAALGSHSRGALLALGAMGGLMWWRGKNKLVTAVGFVVVGAAMASLMPHEWWERMGTIKSYDKDDSALGRINAWYMAFNLAKANFFGGGFQVGLPALFALYAPDPQDLHAAHSIYFMVLGEHGFIGLFLFLTLFLLVYLSAGRLRVQARAQPQTQWLSDLGAMCQVSLAGYAVGGAFLSLSYWDMPYNILVLVVVGRRWLDRKTWLKEKPEPVIHWPAWLRKRFAREKS